jgi:hypothetical protein
VDEGYWFGCLVLMLLILVALTLISAWLVARLVIDGLLLVLLLGEVVRDGDTCWLVGVEGWCRGCPVAEGERWC